MAKKRNKEAQEKTGETKETTPVTCRACQTGLIGTDENEGACTVCGAVEEKDENAGVEGGQGEGYSPSGNTEAETTGKTTPETPDPQGNEADGTSDENSTVVGVLVPITDEERIKDADTALAGLITAARALRAEYAHRGHSVPRIFIENVVARVWQFDNTVYPCPSCGGTGALDDGEGALCEDCDGGGIDREAALAE